MFALLVNIKRNGDGEMKLLFLIVDSVHQIKIDLALKKLRNKLAVNLLPIHAIT